MTDLETYLKTKLNESIDTDLGPARPAPRFEPATPTRTWVRPVLAAASVLVVVGAAVAISRVATSEHTTAAGTTPDAPQQRRAGAAGPCAFHGAKIAIPLGWTAHREQGAGAPAHAVPLPVEGGVGLRDPGDATSIPAARPCWTSTSPVGSTATPPQVCAPQPTPARKLTGTMTRDFGGRQAQWRVWETDCPAARRSWTSSTSMPSSPGFVLYALNPTSDVRDGIDIVAQHSQLPTQNAPLWLTDRGRIQSVSSSVRSGKTIVHLVLARFRPDGSIGNAADAGRLRRVAVGVPTQPVAPSRRDDLPGHRRAHRPADREALSYCGRAVQRWVSSVSYRDRRCHRRAQRGCRRRG